MVRTMAVAVMIAAAMSNLAFPPIRAYQRHAAATLSDQKFRDKQARKAARVYWRQS